MDENIVKNLFDDDADTDSPMEFPVTPKVKRLFSNNSGRLALPSIVEDNGNQSGDSFFGDELNSSDEMMSPTCSPAKRPYSPQQPALFHSPPSIQRGFLALKLLDSPRTPRTLLGKFKDAACKSERTEANENIHIKSRLRLKDRFSNLKNVDRKRPSSEPRVNKSVVYANVNPFTPTGNVFKTKRTKLNERRNEFERYGWPAVGLLMYFFIRLFGFHNFCHVQLNCNHSIIQELKSGMVSVN